MAVDTARKRFSMMGLGNPAVLVRVPAGSVDTAQRATLIHMYEGIAKDTPTEPPVGESGSEKKFLQPILSSVLG